VKEIFSQWRGGDSIRLPAQVSSLKHTTDLSVVSPEGAINIRYVCRVCPCNESADAHMK